MDGKANRYFIMMFDHTEQKYFSSDEDYFKFLKEYASLNKNSKNVYAYGDFSLAYVTGKFRVVNYTVYRKISKSYDLEFLDSEISKTYESETELKDKYPNEVQDGKGKLYIGYMFKGQAKTQPIFYKKDKDYVNYEALKELIKSNALAPGFLAKLWTSPKLNDNEYRAKINLYLENMQVEYGRYAERITYSDAYLKRAIDAFVTAWCHSQGKLSQRNVRVLGTEVRNILDGTERKPVHSTEILGKTSDENYEVGISKIKKLPEYEQMTLF